MFFYTLGTLSLNSNRHSWAAEVPSFFLIINLLQQMKRFTIILLSYLTGVEFIVI